MWTDDPAMDFERHDAAQAEELDKLPTCSCCEEPILQETAVYINDEWICDNCLTEYFRKEVLPEW